MDASKVLHPAAAVYAFDFRIASRLFHRSLLYLWDERLNWCGASVLGQARLSDCTARLPNPCCDRADSV
jgi:hypothetical protein